MKRFYAALTAFSKQVAAFVHAMDTNASDLAIKEINVLKNEIEILRSTVSGQNSR